MDAQALFDKAGNRPIDDRDMICELSNIAKERYNDSELEALVLFQAGCIYGEQQLQKCETMINPENHYYITERLKHFTHENLGVINRLDTSIQHLKLEIKMFLERGDRD